jgi:hypothetical protein
MRKVQQQRSQIIGFQNGQDASQVTLKRQALANVPQPALSSAQANPYAVPTSFSKIGGTVANVLEATQQTSSPTGQSCPTGYRGVANGLANKDGAATLIGNAQACALANECNSSATPYQTVIPCGIFIDPVRYAPSPPSLEAGTANNATTPTFQNINSAGTLVTGPTTSPGTAPPTNKAACCLTNRDILLNATVSNELIATQGQQSAIRQQYNLPTKLQGLRGPIAVGRG